MFTFAPVTRKKAKLRLALTGVSGAGKTLSALYIAYGMTNDWGKIALIDTEHERAQFYADRPDLGTGSFLYAAFEPPYSTERYKAAVTEAAKIVGADGVVIIDSLSHAWAGSGGVLEVKDRIAQGRGQNSYTAWNEAGKLQNQLIDTILAVNCHTICTMRVKMDYAMQENERGGFSPVKVGLAPVQRDSTEYEFDIVLDISRKHIATASKDVTFLDKYGEIITPKLGRDLAAWLNDGAEPPKPPCCEVCGKPIKPTKNHSVESIIAGTHKNTGKQMCMKCFLQWQEKTKAAAKQAENDSAEPPRCEICGEPIQADGKLSVQEIVKMARESTGKQACLKCFKIEYAKIATSQEETAQAEASS